MSQLVLARKYRPHTFSEMVGQDHVVQALTNALTSGRLHHAYMFTGTRGVGKTTVSRILAKSLNCLGLDGQGGVTATPCGQCQACMDIDSGRFVDYTELDAASNRGVDEVQSLLEQAVYKPVQGRFKVFMIDEVHMLTGHAFNAMLKTLEEPPPYLKFVLATTDPQKVPVTVLSRCLQFNLRPIAPQTVFEHLTQVLSGEGLHAQDAALALISKGARGSMRDALSLLDQAIAFGGVGPDQNLTEQAVRQMLSAVDSRHVVALLEALANADGAALVQQCDRLRAEGLSAGACLDELTSVLQRIAVVHVAGPLSGDAVDGDRADVDALADRLPADVVHLLYSLVLQGRPELGLAPDEHAALMMLMLRALVFMPGTGSGGGPDSASGRSPLKVNPPSGKPQDPLAGGHGGLTNNAAATGIIKAGSPAAQSRPIATVAVPPSNQLRSPLPWETSPEPSAHRDSESSASLKTVEPASNVRHLPVRVQSEPTVKTDALQSRSHPSGTIEKPSLVLTEIGDFWFDVVKDLVGKELISALVRELALQSQLIGRDDLSGADGNSQRWQLRVERESLAQASHKDRLEAALASSGRLVQLALEVGTVTDSPAKRQAAQLAEAQAQAEQIIQEDAFVQQMMREFGGKIVPGSIQVKTKTGS